MNKEKGAEPMPESSGHLGEPQVRDALRWISVEDRLPEVDVARGFYGLATDGRHVFPASYMLVRMNIDVNIRECKWFAQGQFYTGDASYCVTHWRPFPELPEAKP